MKQIAAWIALALTVVLAVGSRSRGQDQGSNRVENVYKTEHEEHVTVERTTTTTVKETTVVHVAKPNYKCAIFVANHADNVDNKKAIELEDLLTGYASGKGFTIISRDDVISAVTNLNGPGNGQAPANHLDTALSNDSSALRVAQTLGADYVLVCTITAYDTDKQTYRDPAQDIDLVSLKHQLRTTFRLLNAADGGAVVAGVAVASIVDRVDPREEEMKRENVIDDLLDADALNMADMLAQDARGGMVAAGGADHGHADVKFNIDTTVADLSFPMFSRRDDGKYEVMAKTYHPEVLDATVSMDGIVIGSTKDSLRATPGLHEVRIHHALFHDWRAMVNIHEGMKLDVALELNDEGRKEYAELTRMFEHLEAHAVLSDTEAKALESKPAELGHGEIRVDTGQGSQTSTDMSTSTTRP